MIVTGTLNLNNRTYILSGSEFVQDSPTFKDISIDTLVSSSITSATMVQFEVVGIYTPPSAGIGTARMHKKWTQHVYYDGTKYVIDGAAVDGTVYNSDSTNFGAGANNTLGVATSYANSSGVFVRFKNRTTTTPTGSTALFVYKITSIIAQ